MNENADDIRKAVQERFGNVALNPDEEKTFPVGPENAKTLGYDQEEIDALPLSVTESFCGVGNPFSLGGLEPGETTLDMGSGAGLDCVVAARRVGPTGKTIGVDMTPNMIEKSRTNLQSLNLNHAEIREGFLEELPVDDSTIDVVTSNGVFNLCLEKPKVVAEVFRVLRPGGRLQMADILLHEDVTPEEVALKGEWSD
jgi:SAM-dependent methyltransferase